MLQGGELWPREGAVGYYASNEGLEDLRSEESPIAIQESRLGQHHVSSTRSTDLIKWYGAGDLKRDRSGMTEVV